MTSDRESNCELLSHLGFDFLGHLEDMKSKGVHSVDIKDFAPATPTALRGWEDANFPYRLPVELRAFLGASDGYSLTWTVKHDNATERGGLEVVTGRIRINRLSAITRLSLDSDDLINIASSYSREAALAAATTSAPGGYDKAYGIAAFSLDSSCGVGEVALVYGGAPLNNGISRKGAGSCEKGKRTSVAHLTSPQVWLHDLSCRQLYKLLSNDGGSSRNPWMAASLFTRRAQSEHETVYATLLPGQTPLRRARVAKGERGEKIDENSCKRSKLGINQIEWSRILSSQAEAFAAKRQPDGVFSQAVY